MHGQPALVPAIAIPGLHERFVAFFLEIAGERPPASVSVLDAGAGHGGLSARVHALGFRVQACDFAPELFLAKDVEFRQSDLTERLPFDDGSFDYVIAVEVLEHLPDHVAFFRECARVLRPGGRLLLSTPNVVSLKSRLRFLLTGFFYSFQTLDMDRHDGLQHVASLTPDQCSYRARRAGLGLERLTCDKYQSSSVALAWLVPQLLLASRWVGIDAGVHGTRDLLFGRKVFAAFGKPARLTGFRVVTRAGSPPRDAYPAGLAADVRHELRPTERPVGTPSGEGSQLERRGSA